MKRALRMVVALAALLAGVVQAAEPSAVGRWRQLDDADGKPRSIVLISEREGTYEGRIEQLFPRPGDAAEAVCDKCTDARRGQKILGLRIMEGLQRKGLEYEGGEILDPGNGKVYRVRMTLSPDGQRLDVRGFIGVALFGRTQTWLREP
ncbi:DUF2147 domain-containing protein [Niveibacterium sp. SC-1]|uniref:DUF2147 domain-containing protein n=1 Tax=Niveibacterium sp. SC-1 TaxID=3135646 RepID=UPI00311D7DBE